MNVYSKDDSFKANGI